MKLLLIKLTLAHKIFTGCLTLTGDLTSALSLTKKEKSVNDFHFYSGKLAPNKRVNSCDFFNLRKTSEFIVASFKNKYLK